jgi:glucitol/sorbitol PTS system EIIA component
MIYYTTTVTAIGEEVPDLLDGGVLILYADGAPAALAEVSVQHRVSGEVNSTAPPVGAQLTVGALSARVSAVGATAWNKVRELGHVVLNFNGAGQAERPGEICVERLDLMAVREQVRSGNCISITD